MQLSSGKPLSSSVLGSIFRSWSTYRTGRSEREERGEGRSEDPSASDGGVTIGSNLLSSSGNR